MLPKSFNQGAQMENGTLTVWPAGSAIPLQLYFFLLITLGSDWEDGA